MRWLKKPATKDDILLAMAVTVLAISVVVALS